LGPGPSWPGVRVLGAGQLGPAPSRHPSPPLGHRLWCLGGGARLHPSPLYKWGPKGGEEYTIPLALLHLATVLYLLGRQPPPPPFLYPAWPPEGLGRWEISPSLHAVVLWSFRIPSKAIYFRNIGWIGDSGSHRDRRTCASTRRCRSCGARVVVPRSSRP
jgi:hypothetical protein